MRRLRSAGPASGEDEYEQKQSERDSGLVYTGKVTIESYNTGKTTYDENPARRLDYSFDNTIRIV